MWNCVKRLTEVKIYHVFHFLSINSASSPTVKEVTPICTEQICFFLSPYSPLVAVRLFDRLIIHPSVLGGMKAGPCLPSPYVTEDGCSVCPVPVLSDIATDSQDFWDFH